MTNEVENQVQEAQVETVEAPAGEPASGVTEQVEDQPTTEATDSQPNAEAATEPESENLTGSEE